MSRYATLEQFQQKCEAVLRPELRKIRGLETFRDSKKRGISLAGFAGILAALAGCSSIADPMLTASTLQVSPTASQEVAPQSALAMLPGNGTAVLTVRQSRADDRVTQDIILANDTTVTGENTLSVDIGPAGARPFRRAPSRSEIDAEMHKALPGITMAISPTIAENAYGVFGYASGAMPGGGRCLYAWQVIKDLAGDRAGPFFASRAASIRLRLCQSGGSQSLQAALMRGLQIRSFGDQPSAMPAYAERSDVSVPVAAPAPAPLQTPARTHAVRTAPASTVKKTVTSATVPIPVATSVSATATALAAAAAPAPAAVVANAVTVPLPDAL
jgi:hypothetical protein